MSQEIVKIEEIKIGNRFRKDLGELEELKKSIQEIGLLHPVVIDENNNLVAGLRRIRAFKELGYDEIPVNQIDIKDILQGEYDENIIRQNFTQSEAVAIWDAMKNYQKTGQKRPPSETDEPRVRTSKITKKSTDTLSKAKQVVEFGNQKLISEMDKTGNVNKVYRKVKAGIRKQEIKEKAKNYKEDNDIQIIQDDFRKTEIKENSIDLILTDPPYPREFLDLWQDLFIYAEKVLKPSSFLIAYSGQIHLDEIFKMKNNLIYYWMMSIEFTAKPMIIGRNIIACWKPILIFQKPPFKKIEGVIEDKIKFDYTERELHEKNWGQTIKPFEFLLEKFSQIGELVLDPFAGTGTTLLACKNKKRKCIGIEIEKQYIDIIKGRLNE